MCGKHTMVRLQICLQPSKQLDQNGSKNAAKFVVCNQTKCLSCFLHCMIRHRPSSACPRSYKKKSRRLPIAPLRARGSRRSCYACSGGGPAGGVRCWSGRRLSSVGPPELAALCRLLPQSRRAHSQVIVVGKTGPSSAAPARMPMNR
jgi:hypothetical protein